MVYHINECIDFDFILLRVDQPLLAHHSFEWAILKVTCTKSCVFQHNRAGLVHQLASLSRLYSPKDFLPFVLAQSMPEVSTKSLTTKGVIGCLGAFFLGSLGLCAAEPGSPCNATMLLIIFFDSL
jgi:hypothetical protein